jgi:hypothetical protein
MLPGMRARLWKRFRDLLAFLADLAGAVVAVAFGAGLIVGALIVATKLLPLVPLLLVSIGAALITFGCVVRALAPRWKSEPAASSPAVSPAVDNPYTGAVGIQEAWSAGEVLKAARTIREELIDNRAILARMKEGATAIRERQALQSCHGRVPQASAGRRAAEGRRRLSVGSGQR